MFDVKELNQLLYFLGRANLTGNESVAHAALLIKIQNLIQRETPTEE